MVMRYKQGERIASLAATFPYNNTVCRLIKSFQYRISYFLCANLHVIPVGSDVEQPLYFIRLVDLVE